MTIAALVPLAASGALMAALGAGAEPRPTDVARYVVIVANNRSLTADVLPLQYADDDGVAYYDLFLPYARRVALLTDLDDATQSRVPSVAAVTKRPDSATLRETLRSTYAEIRAEKAGGRARTELVFVFVGHGGMDEQGRGFVHLSDKPWGRAALFKEVVAASPADYTHVIIDACNAFSLVAGRGGTPAPRRSSGRQGPRPDLVESFLAHDDLSEFPNVGVLVAMSGDRETHEWSRIGAGIFSHEVRSALRGAADVDLDGRLEYSEIAAFVEGANAAIADSAKRLSVLAIPPARDRHAALLELQPAASVRQLRLTGGVSGQLYVETERGRIAEFNKPARSHMELYVPASVVLFLRNDRSEIRIAAGSDSVTIAQNPSSPVVVASRGVTEKVLLDGLFAMPFSYDYYRGFVAGHSELPAVRVAAGDQASAATGRPELTAKVGVEPTDPLWEASVGYGVGNFPLADHRWTQSVVLGIGRRVLPFLLVHASADVGYTSLRGLRGGSAANAGLSVGLTADSDLTPSLRLLGALDLGWAVLSVDGKAHGADWTVGTARAGVGLSVPVSTSLSLVAGPGASVMLVTIDGREKWNVRWDGRAGLSWTF